MTERKTALLHELEKKKVRADQFTRVAIVLTTIFIAGTLVAMVLLIIESAQSSRANTELLREVQETSRVLEDCTTPGGECYREGQQRTAQAVSNIGRGTAAVIAAALACQEQGYTQERPLLRCIERSLD